MAPTAWEKWVEQELRYERAVEFLEDEVPVVEGIIENLRATDEENCWHSLTKEFQRMILRGLRFRKHKVRDMSNITRDIYKFRIDNKMDNSLNELWSNHNVYWKAWPSYVAGQDMYGHWVNYETVGEMSVKTLDLVSTQECVMMRCQYYEAQMEIKRRVSMNIGMRTNKFVYIFDLKELSFSKHFTKKVQRTIQPLLEVCGDMYPDVLWNMYVINSPVTFSMIWRIISPWVDKDVKPKVHILRGQSQYLPRMQKCGIPLDSIPKACGGNCDIVSMRDVIEDMVEKPQSMETYFRKHPEVPDGHTVDILADDTEEEDKRKAAAAALEEKKHQAEEAEATERDEDEEELFNEGDVIMEGFLSKRGAFNQDWKKRYFILTPHTLMYFTGDPRDEAGKLKGKIELFMVSAVNRSSPESDKTGEFDIVTPFRTYNIRVDDGKGSEKGEIMTDWITSVAEAAAEEACTLTFRNGGTVGVNHVRSGFLKKRGVFNKMFKRRYFILTSTGLYYYNGDPTNPKTVPKGQIRLSKVKKVTKGKASGVLEVHTKYRIFILKAEHEADQLAWIQTLRETVDSAKKSGKPKTEVQDEVRNIPYLDRVAVIEAEQSLEGSGGFQASITGFVRRAIDMAASLNMITNESTGEKLRGDQDAVASIMDSAAERMQSMLSYVYEVTVGRE